MSIEATRVIIRALWIWPFLAAVFAGLVFTGFAHGPWNYCWFFAMGCDAVLGVYWSLAACAARQITPSPGCCVARLTSVVPQVLYCLPLSSIPILGQRIFPHNVTVEILGALMSAVGVGFAIWSRRILAGNWRPAAALPEGHTLVRSGPYSIVRHPIYLGMLVTWVGMFLVLGEVRALVCFWHAEKLLKRMMAEESILRETYPKDYPDYERSVKRLVPCIW